MHWSSWQAFWDMGGYALFVWGSFGVTFLLIALEVWQARASWREEFANLTDAIHIDNSLQETLVHPRSAATLTPVVAPKTSTGQDVPTPSN
jgi:heme exporter protein D